MNGKNIIYFDRFGVEHILKEMKKFIRHKNIISNIYRIQAFDSIMCGYFCNWIYWFYAKRQKFLRLYKLYSPNKYEKNDETLQYFQKLNRLALFVVSIENFKNLKIHTS